MDEIIEDFLKESEEGLEAVQQEMVELKTHPDDTARLTKVCRCVHTIKGTCGFLGYEKLETVTKVGEELLVRLRDGKAHLNADNHAVLGELFVAVRGILGNIRTSQQEGGGDYTALVASIRRCIDISA